MWVNAQFPKFPEKNKQTSGFYTDVGSIEYIWTPCLLHSSFGVSLAFWWDFQGFIDIYNQVASPIWQHDYETSYRDLRLLLHSSTKSMFSLIFLPLCENNEGTYWRAFQTFDHHFPNGIPKTWSNSIPRGCVGEDGSSNNLNSIFLRLHWVMHELLLLRGHGGDLWAQAGVLYPQVLSCLFVSLLICTLFVVFYYCIATINIVWYSASWLHLFIEVTVEQSLFYICLLWVFIKPVCIDKGLIFSW